MARPTTRRASLTDAQVRALATLGDRVESAFGSPQDIEWAIDADGRPWLTQSRPITTLYPVPVRSAPLPGDDARVFFCVTLAQGLHRPLTPMGIAAFRVIGSGFLDLIGRRPERIVDGPAGFAVARRPDLPRCDADRAIRRGTGDHAAGRWTSWRRDRRSCCGGLFADQRFSVLPRSRRRFAAARSSSRRPAPAAA